MGLWLLAPVNACENGMQLNELYGHAHIIDIPISTTPSVVRKPRNFLTPASHLLGIQPCLCGVCRI